MFTKLRIGARVVPNGRPKQCCSSVELCHRGLYPILFRGKSEQIVGRGMLATVDPIYAIRSESVVATRLISARN
jgi:hypothetical protein